MSKSDKIKALSSMNDYIKASNADGLCIIQGSAPWCANCKVIAPEYSKMADEFGEKARFYVFDIDQMPDIAQELGINLIPSFALFKDGDLLEGITGAKVKKLREVIEANV